MQRRTILCTALAFALAGCAAHEPGKEHQGNQAMNLHAILSVDASHDKVLATLRFENRGERRVWLPNAAAADTRLTNRLFELREHPGGAEVAYLGPMVKRLPFTAADYVELAPHSAHTHTIDITRYYAFKPGQHTYEIRWNGLALADAKQLDAFTEVAAAPVMFTHTAP
ncbi:hypothetical protein [uncultured Massilia sp.]|uniref:hypothetical protein n=1 Tax=uncultured Massilia sp. TaxID=169973 RepID=UPI0025CFBDA3|nr:hypothetical protein [uncultured Massilia sp.]